MVLQGNATGTTTDFDGNYTLTGIAPGVHNVVVSFLGYATYTAFEVETTPARPAVVNAALVESAVAVEAAEVVVESRGTVEEAPLSVRSIGTNEIKRNPGGGRDISRALRSLPGVAAIPSFRNDIVIRGGAPNENRFYLDGIEIPNINHFATQGASGGPVGMINVDLVEGVDFYAGAFPAARGNALSSVMEFRFKEPRTDQWTANAVVGTSDLGVTFEGPTGDNSSLIFSLRRSYLQLLFQAIGLPFLPTYNDYQYKWVWRPDDKNAITFLGLGALDDFELNTGLADDPSAPDYLNQVAILDVLPISEQWNYMQGVKWDRYKDDGKWTLVLSRNMLNNTAFKHIDNDETLDRTLDYVSQEIENKFRAERARTLAPGWKMTAGVSGEYAKYNNSTKNVVFVPGLGSATVTYSSAFKMAKYGAFVQSSKAMLDNRLTLSGGLRVDGASLLSVQDDLEMPDNRHGPGQPTRPVQPAGIGKLELRTGLDMECQRGDLPPIASLHGDGLRRFCGLGVGHAGQLAFWDDVHDQPAVGHGLQTGVGESQRRSVARGLLQGLRGVARQRHLRHRLGQPWGGLRGRGQRGSDVRRRRTGLWHGSLVATAPVQGVLRPACLHACQKRIHQPW